jgi:membrane protein required for colicin V production
MIFFMVKGLVRGFIRELGSLAGVIFGVWLGIRAQPQMTGYLDKYLPFIRFLPLISFLAIFTMALILGNFSGWILRLILGRAFTGRGGRTLGAGLATLKGVIIIYLAIVLLTFSIPSQTPLIAESKFSPFIITSYQSMIGFFSQDHFKRLLKKIKDKKDDVSKIGSDLIEDINKDHE